MFVILGLDNMPPRIKAQFADAMKRAMFDCRDRFDDGGKRCVTLTMSFVPKGQPDKEGAVPMEWAGDVKVSLPAYKSALYGGYAVANPETKEGGLVIQDESLSDPRQATIDMFMGKAVPTPEAEREQVDEQGEVTTIQHPAAERRA